MTESALVSCEWLQQHLGNKNLVILDATFFLPRQRRHAIKEFQHPIHGAQFFDIDDIADLTNALPHSVPRENQFAEAVGKMGIDSNTDIIIYDNNHFFAAARAWWMFRLFGHESVRVLDGGLKRWKQLNIPLDTGSSPPLRKIYKTRYRPELIRDLSQMISIQQTGSRIILDARSSDSYLGLRAMAISDLQPGHIPNSINLPYANLTDNEHDTLLPKQQLQQLFIEAGIDLTQPLVTSCGSGVSAAVLLLALYQIGLTDIPMYDGSWAEWGRQTELPIGR